MLCFQSVLYCIVLYNDVFTFLYVAVGNKLLLLLQREQLRLIRIHRRVTTVNLNTHRATKVKVADLQSYNLKIYKSLPKTYNSIRMTIHQSFKTQLFLHKSCKLLHKMATN